MSLSWKKVPCPFCDGIGTRGGHSCPACDGGQYLYVNNKDEFSSKCGGSFRGTWGGKYELLASQGVQDEIT